MARRTYYTQPYEKKLEVFEDFSKGMNTTTSQATMLDSELTLALNISLDDRGSLTKRSGMDSYKTPTILEGEAQGHFRHYKTQYEFVDITARNGQLEIDGVIAPDISFQTTRPIEAVQYYDKTYFATGTGLFVYDGETVKKVEPHRPQPLDALYIGTNALADNPDDYLDNGTGSTTQLTGVTFSSRYGIMNEPFTMTAYYSKKEEDKLEFQFEYRYPTMEAGAYIMGQDWSTNNKWTHTPVGEGDMQFRINARAVGKEVAEAQYLVPTYRVKASPDPKDIAPVVGGIQTCNRILVHWDRLLLYGDIQNSNTLYMSHLKNPAYFPVPNNLNFETEKNEALTTIVRFRDYLVAFTDSSIQALFGKGPSDYRRTVLNTSIGCIAPKSAVVMDNYLAFLSAEGVYYLKSVGYVDDKANVSPLASNIANLVPNQKDAVGIIFEDQYHLVFPTNKIRFRYYKLLGSWVMDSSPYLDITSLDVFDNEMYGQRKDGQIVKFDRNIYRDLDHWYTSVIETKYFDFQQPYHTKKMKELQVIASAQEAGQVADVKVFLDGVRGQEDILEYIANLNLSEDYTTFIDKIKISGKCFRVKLRIEHHDPEFVRFLGFSFILKTKKP